MATLSLVDRINGGSIRAIDIGAGASCSTQQALGDNVETPGQVGSSGFDGFRFEAVTSY
jgi:hypothetical protein